MITYNPLKYLEVVEVIFELVHQSTCTNVFVRNFQALKLGFYKVAEKCNTTIDRIDHFMHDFFLDSFETFCITSVPHST